MPTGVDRLGGPLAGVRPVQRVPPADDLNGLGGVREGASPAATAVTFTVRHFGAAVAALPGVMGGRDQAPGQGGELGVQAGRLRLTVIRLCAPRWPARHSAWPRWVCMASAVTTAPGRSMRSGR